MDNLPRKEAVRALLTVLNKRRKEFPAEYPGQHRMVINEIIDRCESLTKESPYKTRFKIDGDNVYCLVKKEPYAVINLGEFDGYLTDCAVRTRGKWSTSVAKFSWLSV